MTAKGLANAYAQTLGQIFTHEMKPYEIEVMIAEIGNEVADTKIYRIQFDGTLRDVRGYGAMGGMEEQLAERLEAAANGLPDLSGAVRLAAETIEGVTETTVAAADWEAAVLDRTLGRRKFRRITADEIEAARS